jgi:hypothetical protein
MSIQSAIAVQTKIGNFLAELKRRDVYKVAVAYVLVGWALAQGIAQVLPVFDVPNWVVRLVVVFIALGFPMALVLAWLFDMTAQGIKRTDDISQKESHDIRRQLEAQAQQEFVRGYLCALSYAGMADKPNAIDHLNRVYLNNGNGHNTRIAVDPLLGSLPGDVSFEAFADETPPITQLGQSCEGSGSHMQPALGDM